MTLARSLRAIRACGETIAWAKDYKTLGAAWKVCERGDWMLWLCGQMEGTKGWPTRQQIVLVCCDCAELSLPIYEKKCPGDERPRTAIETARKWAKGDASIEDVRSDAADAAYAADAAAAAAAYAAYAAAADAYAAPYAAAAAADAYAAAAAYAAADAYPAPYAAAARTTRLRECADLCRKGLKIPETIGAAKGGSK